MDLNIRDFPDVLAKDAKVGAIDRGLSLREFVIRTIQFALVNAVQFGNFVKEGQFDGDEQGRSKGGVGQNHGKVPVDRRRTGDVRVSDAEASVRGQRGHSGVPKVRGGVSGGGSDEGKASGVGSGAVRGSLDDSPTKSSAVGGGAQPDTRSEGNGKVWLGPPHAKVCNCPQCQLAKGGKR